MKDSKQKTLEINEKQKEFYNSKDKYKKNLSSRMWSKLRNGLLNNFRQQFDIKDRVYNEHKAWLGDLSDKKVLDLGCLRGNVLSLYIAKNAKEYVGIDLSDVAISELSARLKKANCSNARAVAVDFLSSDFKDSDFDVIYAFGVLHHFEDFDLLISQLNKKLSLNGLIIAYDPLETSFPIKVLRTIYRPFQSDKDWEWPFKKSTLKKINTNFNILKMRGVLGKSKYGILVNMIPFLKKTTKKNIVKKWVDKDWNIKELKDSYACMHITMLLQKQ